MTKPKIKKVKGTERKKEHNIYTRINSKGDEIGFSVRVGNVRVHAPGQKRGTFKTLQAARRARDNYIETMKDGAYSLCQKTLNEVFQELNVKGADIGKKALNTQYNQNKYYINYIEPVLNGNRLIRTFTREDIKYLRNIIMNANGVRSKKPLAQGTKRSILVFAFNIFRFALHEEYIDNDICRGIDLPPAVRAKKECLSPEQIEVLTTEVNRLFPFHLNLYAGFYLLLETGARPGEICGLRWCDIDLDKRIVSIKQAINRLTGKPGKTKTPESVREVFLTDNLYNALCKILEYRKKTGVKVKGTDYILTSSKVEYTGKNVIESNLQDIIVRLGKRCGIKITPKSFRKTTSTVYYEKYGAGVAARQLGHTTTRMVETVYSDMDTIYRNTFPRMGRDSRNSAIIS